MWTLIYLYSFLNILIMMSVLIMPSFGYGQQPPITDLKEHLKTHKTAFWRDLLRNSKAAEMLNYMDLNVDPCTDFYEYSCGKWSKVNPANNDKKITTGFFENLNLAATKKMSDLLTGKIMNLNETNTDKKVKNYYKSCISFIENDNITDYRNKLLEIIAEFGEMPALVGDNWDESEFDWLETVAKISRKYGTKILFDMSIQPDFLNNSINRIYFGQAELPLQSKAMYLNDTTKVYRTNYGKNIARNLMIYLDMNVSMAVSTAVDILKFEKLLAVGLMDDKMRLSLSEVTEKLSLEELHRKYSPVFNLKKYFNISIGKIDVPIIEYMEEFQKNLYVLIGFMSTETVANYIFYRLLEPFFISFDEKPDKICMEKTKLHFIKVLDNMVYRKFNTEDTEKDIFLIWNELKSSFKEEFESENLSWITLSTRQKAIEKLEAMKLEINSYANENFTEEFEEMNITESDYIENFKNVLQVSREKHLNELGKPPKPLNIPDIVSYSPVNIVLENTIKIPISFLQPFYLWADSYPNAIKFGSLGSLVGHEMMHGFDDNGRTYDKFGNDNDWWDKDSTFAFKNRTSCFKDQYKKYVYKGVKLPESEAQAENIADNGGLSIAYKAYLKWYDEESKLGNDMHFELMPYLNVSSKELFFITFAQFWCNDVAQNYINLQTVTDEHTPGKFRVIGTLSNSQEFSDVFKCAPNTPMNPKNKCKIY